jgi:TonB family protein
MRAAVLALAAISTALLPTPVFAETVVLKPSGPWNVDFGETKCRLNRLFGQTGNQHLLAFEQYYPSSGTGLFIAGPAFTKFGSGKQTELSLIEAEPPLKYQPFTGTVDDFGTAVIFSTVPMRGQGVTGGDADHERGPGIPRLDTDFAKKVRSLTVIQGDKSVKLETGPLGDAIAALNQCSEDLVYSWGFDLDQHRTASRRPVWLNEQAIAEKLQSEYPVGALKNGRQAILRMRVTVDAEGKVEDCVLLSVAQEGDVKSRACQQMERAKFEPALDAAGQPMRSYYTSTITYSMTRRTQ